MDAYDPQAIERSGSGSGRTSRPSRPNPGPGAPPTSARPTCSRCSRTRRASCTWGTSSTTRSATSSRTSAAAAACSVLRPMGYDAFGLPAENAAIREGGHPREVTERNIAAIRRADEAHGLVDRLDPRGLDPRARVLPLDAVAVPALLRGGLAYRKEAPVKWCPNDQTVLANEQVIDGRCERCGTEVEARNLEQWFFRITDYADRLLDEMELLESWPERVLTMQRNWIGRSEGARDPLPGRRARRGRAGLHDAAGHAVRRDVLRRSRPSIRWSTQLVARHRARGRGARLRRATPAARSAVEREAEGEGRRLHRPLRGQPRERRADPDLGRRLRPDGLRHRRDHGRARARRARLRVRASASACRSARSSRPPTARSRRASRTSRTPRTRCSSTPASSPACRRPRRSARSSSGSRSAGCGKPTISYRLRDWLLSRQRYWGCPIPIVHCDALRRSCPVPGRRAARCVLPEIDDYLPKGRSPLAAAEDWVQRRRARVRRAGAARDRHDGHVRRLVLVLPALHRPAQRRGAVRPRDGRLLAAGQPVHRRDRARDPAPDVRALLHEGAERPRHARLPRAVRAPVQPGDDPPQRREDVEVEGQRRRARRAIERYGADALRLYILFMGPADQDKEWQDTGVEGMLRFLQRLWRVVARGRPSAAAASTARRTPLARKAHETIAKVTDDIERRFVVQHADRGRDGARQRDVASTRTTRPRGSPPRRRSR